MTMLSNLDNDETAIVSKIEMLKLLELFD